MIFLFRLARLALAAAILIFHYFALMASFHHIASMPCVLLMRLVSSSKSAIFERLVDARHIDYRLILFFMPIFAFENSRPTLSDIFFVRRQMTLPFSKSGATPFSSIVFRFRRLLIAFILRHYFISSSDDIHARFLRCFLSFLFIDSFHFFTFQILRFSLPNSQA